MKNLRIKFFLVRPFYHRLLKRDAFRLRERLRDWNSIDPIQKNFPANIPFLKTIKRIEKGWVQTVFNRIQNLSVLFAVFSSANADVFQNDVLLKHSAC